MGDLEARYTLLYRTTTHSTKLYTVGRMVEQNGLFSPPPGWITTQFRLCLPMSVGAGEEKNLLEFVNSWHAVTIERKFLAYFPSLMSDDQKSFFEGPFELCDSFTMCMYDLKGFSV